MTVDSEVLMGSEGMGIYRSSIRNWDAPYDDQLVTDTERARVLENIREAFQFQGFDIAVI